MGQKGFLEAERLKSIFSMLRPNELVWSFFIKNYLLGQVPPAFDFLYWNSDSTRLPASLHREILRDWFQKNLLMMPGGMTIKGVPLDVRNITTPTMFLSTIDDHISPWKSSYPAVHLFKGPLKFVLAGSGHVAGVMNPPERNKYGFFTNSSFPYSPEEWFESAGKTEGSWWPLWQEWAESFGEYMMVPPANYSSLGPAPGVYVSAE
jgi:polyhydroxyalkanoate synthase subunit PhaC